MKPALLLALGLALTLPLAGCASEEDAGAQATDPSSSSSATRGPRDANGTATATATTTGTPGNGSSASGNPTGNATGNSTGNATGNATLDPTWSYDNRTGTVEGFAVPLLEEDFSVEEAFDVENGTLRLVLNLTVDGDDVTLTLHPPGCEEDECASEAETADGKATLEPDGNVTAGAWTATLTVSGFAGGVGADYELSIATLAVRDNATAPPS